MSVLRREWDNEVSEIRKSEALIRNAGAGDAAGVCKDGKKEPASQGQGGQPAECIS